MHFLTRIPFYIVVLLLLSCNSLLAEKESAIVLGVEQSDRYLPFLKGKSIAVVANQTSVLNGTHLVDTLLSSGVSIVKIFSPEHGFRGQAEAGAYVDNAKDSRTGLPVISLYGANKKPTLTQMQDVEMLVFDIQDVGARFYTYISSLHYIMEACAQAKIPLIIFDRPNPHAFYVDGPILDPKYKSFVGMHPVPIVHGLTIGEYALMINGQKWLADSLQCDLIVIPMQHYTHKTPYKLPIPPSPNLRSMSAVYAYPSLCLFEGTAISVARGTYEPFEKFGFPNCSIGQDTFHPTPISGLSERPLYQGMDCIGFDVSDSAEKDIKANKQLNLSYLIRMYEAYPDKDLFFNNFFAKLAGTELLRKQIESGMNEAEIRATWEEGLAAYRAMSSTYILYP